MMTPARLSWMSFHAKDRMRDGTFAEDASAWDWALHWIRLGILLQAWRAEGRGWLRVDDRNHLDLPECLGPTPGRRRIGRRLLRVALASLHRGGLYRVGIARRDWRRRLRYRLVEGADAERARWSCVEKLWAWLEERTEWPAEVRLPHNALEWTNSLPGHTRNRSLVP